LQFSPPNPRSFFSVGKVSLTLLKKSWFLLFFLSIFFFLPSLSLYMCMAGDSALIPPVGYVLFRSFIITGNISLFPFFSRFPVCRTASLYPSFFFLAPPLRNLHSLQTRSGLSSSGGPLFFDNGIRQLSRLPKNARWALSGFRPRSLDAGRAWTLPPLGPLPPASPARPADGSFLVAIS